MSLFSWMFPARKPVKPQAESSGLSRMQATRPAGRRTNGKDAQTNNAQPANRKSERMARRELLYAVVREAMMRAGVLTASYKFKVLSLDARGRQFMVMMDLSRDYGSETARLAEIEALIAQGAKTRHDIVVTAVYWRMNEHVAVGDPNAQLMSRSGATSQPAPLDSQPAVLDSQPAVLDSQPALLDSRPALLDSRPVPLAAWSRATQSPATPHRTDARYDPIQPDEVAAFKLALAAGAARPAAVPAASAGVPQGASAKAFDGSSKHGPQSYTLLTGFEDTELPDADLRMPALSSTQYGDLN